ncbi:hypothetical protein V8C35DRAFT_291767 [Trichoderma chlorosporum]
MSHCCSPASRQSPFLSLVTLFVLQIDICTLSVLSEIVACEPTREARTHDRAGILSTFILYQRLPVIHSHSTRCQSRIHLTVDP